MNLPKFVPSDRNQRKKFIAVLGAAVLAVMTLVSYLIWSGYREAILAAEMTSRNYAAVIEARLDATLRRADAILQERVRTLPVAAFSQQAVPRYAREINATLDSYLSHFEELSGLRIFDAAGDQLYTSNRANTPRTNIADRDHFRRLRDDPRAGLEFSEVVTSRSSGRPTMGVARALRDAQGVFRGVVSAPIELEYFEKLFRSLNLGAHSTISVRHTGDQKLIVRWPPLPDALNKPLVNQRNPTVQGLAPANRTRTQQIRSETDGVMRIFSSHTLERYPFRVAVGFSRDDVLAVWRARSLSVALLGLLLLIVVASLLYSLWHAEARRARAIIALAQREEQAKLVLDASMDAVICMTSDSMITEWNPGAERMFGYAGSKAIGRAMFDLISPPALRDIYRLRIQKFLEPGKAPRIGGLSETTAIRADGHEFPVEFSIALIPRDSRHFFSVFVRDITKRKQAENSIRLLNETLEQRVAERTRALRESQERFRALAETIEEVFWMADIAIRKIVYISPGYERIWGRSLQSLYDNPSSFIEVMHPEDRERALTTLEVQKLGKPFDHEYRITRPDGSIRWIWDRGFPIQSKTGKISLYAGVATDITERKHAEEKQRASEERAHELLRRLIETQEVERLRIAADLHDVIGQNLSALEIELQRLRGAARPGEVMDNMARIIQDSTNSVREAISDLHPAVLDDYGVLAAIKAYVGHIERLTNLRISVQGNAPETRPPRNMELALYRVAQESLMNTAKHAAASRVTVEFSRVGEVLRLRVEDDGIGIAPIPPGSKRADGWGIEFMRERAEALGGHLHIESPGSGTRVIMEIPLGNSRHPG